MEEVRWGIIGCGSVAEHKGGPALYNVPRSRLVAVMSRSLEKARSFAGRHGAARYLASVEDLLSDPEVDAVYVATPPNSHAELTARAAAAGKHVLCEKPMAMNPSECREMIAACRDNGVQLMIAYYRRTYPVVNKVKEILDRGLIGEPVYCRVLTSSLYDGARGWRLDPAVSGGGFMVDIGSHRLDLLAYFLGEAEEVTAIVESRGFDIPVEDSSSLQLRFTSGVPAVAQFFWTMATPVDELDIGGTRGRLLVRDLEKGELQVSTDNGTEDCLLPRGPITHLGLVEDFVESLLVGRPNCLPGEEGMKATQMIEAAYQSSEEGRVVRLGDGIAALPFGEARREHRKASQ